MYLSTFVVFGLQPYNCLLVKGEYWDQLTDSWSCSAEGCATGIPISSFWPAVDYYDLTRSLIRCTAQIMSEGCGTPQHGSTCSSLDVCIWPASMKECAALYKLCALSYPVLWYTKVFNTSSEAILSMLHSLISVLTKQTFTSLKLFAEI